MAVGLPLKTTYLTGDVYQASDVNDTNGTVNLFQTSTLSLQAGKNAIINGGFDVWQRGTSFAVPTSYGYTADRWRSYRGAFASGATISRQVTGDTTNLASIQYALRMQRDSGNTSTAIMYLDTTVETINSIPYAGKTVTLSFYARRGANFSATSNVFGLTLYSGTGTDQAQTSFTGKATVATINATLTTTWQRFTVSGTVAATATELGLEGGYTPVGTAGAADYFEITGVQVELGSATTFTRTGGSIQGELANCQRYYVRYTCESGAPYAVFATSGLCESTTQAVCYTTLPVQLRSYPTAAEFGGSVVVTTPATAQTVTSIAIQDRSSAKIISLTYTVASGLTTGQFAVVRANNSSTAYLGFSAEL